jgi:hypothetical protein
VEGAAAQLFANNLPSVASFTASNVTFTPANTTAPDGTLTGILVTEDNDAGPDQVHRWLLAPAITAATAYTVQQFYKYKTSGRPWVCLRNSDASKVAYFNIQYGYWGTITGGATVGLAPGGNGANGWYAPYMSCTSSTTADNWEIYFTATDNDLTYVDDGRDCGWVWYAGLELGSFATSIVPRLTAAASRIADDLSIPTYRLRNTLKDIVSTTPTMWLDFGQDPSGATIVDNSGTYTLTKAGQPKRYTSPVYGDYHLFASSGDYYTSASADFFNLTGDFTISFVFTPSTVSGTKMIFNHKGAGSAAIELYQSGATINFLVHDGTLSTVVTKNACLVSGKTSLVSIAFTRGAGATNSTVNIRVDALAVETSAVSRKPTGTAGTSYFGAYNTGAFGCDGKLHYYEHRNGTALSASDHSNMYAALKLPGCLPLRFGGSTSTGGLSHYSKIRIKGEYKHEGLADFSTATSNIVSIGGNITTPLSKDRISVRCTATTLYASIWGTSGTQYYMSKTGMTHNKWNTFDVIFDLANMANSTGLVNALATTLDAGCTGTATEASMLDANISVGKDNANTATAYANAFIRNLEILIGSD